MVEIGARVPRFRHSHSDADANADASPPFQTAHLFMFLFSPTTSIPLPPSRIVHDDARSPAGPALLAAMSVHEVSVIQTPAEANGSARRQHFHAEAVARDVDGATGGAESKTSGRRLTRCVLVSTFWRECLPRGPGTCTCCRGGRSHVMSQ